ncbi:MAG: PKD domain-containing protein [Gammaproteobacteria bacterium]
MLGEYSGSLRYGKEYVYLGSQLLASTQTNQAPAANAGPDQSVRGAAIVALDGTASNDTDGHINSYAWQQIGGTPVNLNGADTATPSFTRPGDN